MTTTASAIDLPFAEAIAFLRQKAAVPTRSWRDVWDGAHSKMFMVAGANSEALVKDFQEAIAKALEQGTTLADFRKDFDGIVKTHGWSYKGERGWRTRTIFETNMRTAYAAGRYVQMTHPDVLESHPYWQYHHSGAIHPRQQHKNWDGICLDAEDPFWKTAYPPNGFGCGCFVTAMTQGRLRRLGKAGPDTAPDLDQVGTDQPLGVDPSFAYNPGEAWLRQTAPGPVAVSAKEANVAAFVRSALSGKWPDGSWTPLAIARKELAARLAVPEATEIRLLAETVRSALIELPAETLAVVPRYLVEHGKLTRLKSGWRLTADYKGRTWRATVKVVEREGARPSVHLAGLTSK